MFLDEEFVFNVKNDIKEFIERRPENSVLIFPPVNNYRRLLIHRTAADFDSDGIIATFSIGQGIQRRTVICLKEQIIGEDRTTQNSRTSLSWRTDKSETGFENFHSKKYQRYNKMRVENNSTSLNSNQKSSSTKHNSTIGIYRPPAARKSICEIDSLTSTLTETPIIPPLSPLISLISTTPTTTTTITLAKSIPPTTTTTPPPPKQSIKSTSTTIPTINGTEYHDNKYVSLNNSIKYCNINESNSNSNCTDNNISTACSLSGTVTSSSVTTTTTRQRVRRPDRAVYIPRARRSQTTPPSSTIGISPSSTVCELSPLVNVTKPIISTVTNVTTIQSIDLTSTNKSTIFQVPPNQPLTPSSKSTTTQSFSPSSIISDLNPFLDNINIDNYKDNIINSTPPPPTTRDPFLNNINIYNYKDNTAPTTLHSPILICNNDNNCDTLFYRDNNKFVNISIDNIANSNNSSVNGEPDNLRTSQFSNIIGDNNCDLNNPVYNNSYLFDENELRFQQQRQEQQYYQNSYQTNNYNDINGIMNSKNLKKTSDLRIEDATPQFIKDINNDERDEKEFRRASQEINRSNRRLIKQTFNSDVLQLNDPITDKSNMKTLNCDKNDNEQNQKVIDRETDDWESMFDDNGDCLDPKLLDELTASVGKVTIEQPKTDYKLYQIKQDLLNAEEFPHVLEVSNFPVEFKTQDLMLIFSPFKESGFDIKWVDDTHALAVFSSSKIAAEVLTMCHQFIVVKPLADATLESRLKAKKCASSLQPKRKRPETCAALARRLVTGALGVRLKTAREELENERRVLREAKERKLLAAKQRDEVWDS